MTLRAPFSIIAAALYRVAYKFHHKFFLRPQPPIQTPVIIVGSYLAGGAGKTPFTIWHAKRFQEQGKNVAILCHSTAWDEFIMMQREFQSAESPQIKVFATKNRYKTAKEIQDKFNIILCDDGFEDTRFTNAKRICLDWQEPPTSWKSLLPAGPFRSLKQDHDERETIHLRCSGPNTQAPDIQFAIKSITNYVPGEPLSATLICGLGAPDRFVHDIHAFNHATGVPNIKIHKIITRPDHDKHFAQAIKAELSQGRNIIVTQKDACRLPQQLLTHPKLHIAIQEIKVSPKVQEMLATVTA